MYPATIDRKKKNYVDVTFLDDNIKASVKYSDLEAVSDESDSSAHDIEGVDHRPGIATVPLAARLVYFGGSNSDCQDAQTGLRPDYEFLSIRTRSFGTQRNALRLDCQYLGCPCYRLVTTEQAGLT
jgi:hypothetical protein